MPLLWFQTLHTFVKFYRRHISKENKEDLKNLVRKKFRHEGLSPEIIKILSSTIN